jgi:glycosyltransferase involved in cell wall biosynthesis
MNTTNNKTLKITIITVTYNDKDNLEKTITSVLAQSYPNIEYIIIDGASTDGTLSLINTHAHHLAAWLSEKDQGIYNAMNKGINLATGDYICFLNSGDTLVNPQTITNVTTTIQQLHKKPGIIYGNILKQQPDGSLKEKNAPTPRNIHRMYFCHQSAFVQLQLLQQFHFDETHPLSADLKFFKQCHYAQQTFHHLNIPITIYDQTGISHTARIRSLYDNIAVIKETDKAPRKYLFLARLYAVILWRKLNRKK